MSTSRLPRPSLRGKCRSSAMDDSFVRSMVRATCSAFHLFQIENLGTPAFGILSLDIGRVSVRSVETRALFLEPVVDCFLPTGLPFAFLFRCLNIQRTLAGARLNLSAISLHCRIRLGLLYKTTKLE